MQTIELKLDDIQRAGNAGYRIAKIIIKDNYMQEAIYYVDSFPKEGDGIIPELQIKGICLGEQADFLTKDTNASFKEDPQ